MYNILSKASFIGQKINYLPICPSTNEVLRDLIQNSPLVEGLVVMTDVQTAGKGQRGNSWEAEAGKNIICSILLKPIFLKPEFLFDLNVITALSVYDLVTETLPDAETRIKWPNDVYVKDHKISGILVENIIQKNLIQNSIIGIGINVNQFAFQNPKATSYFIEDEKEHDLGILYALLFQHVEKYYLVLKNNGRQALKEKYLNRLYGYEKLRSFKSLGKEFEGEIKGIDEQGRLLVKAQGISMTFDLKEIEFL